MAQKPRPKTVELMASVSETELRASVERLSVPRHFIMEADENEAAALWIAAQLQRWGYDVHLQGHWRNVVALPKKISGPLTLVGAHYDSVGGCAGADDNASAVAAMLGCAQACAGQGAAVGFISFNREEDGLLGSRDFVEWLESSRRFQVSRAHILEMVGFASDKPGTQQVPGGLPVRIPNTGNFLGLLANKDSHRVLDEILVSASTYLPEFSVIGLRVTLGLEKHFPVLLRSDHAPFWARGIPATMWTDTSEFRNPYYHQPGDKPATLNYKFLRTVTQLLVATVLNDSDDEKA
jgi:Zn-dependent M28 family amino/carboxypeptidase